MSYQHSKFTGYNSKIQIIEEGENKFVLKTLQIPMTLSVVQDVEQRILLQRSALASMGILIPELINTQILQTSKGYNLLIKERFEGLDFVDVVDKENFEFYIDKLLDEIYAPLLRSSDEKYLKAGIDPIVRNFVYKADKNQFCYVDFIPPKVFYKGHYSQEIPEIQGPFQDIRMISHYERSGIVYVQYINFIRIFPQKRKFIQAKFEQFTESIKQPELAYYLKQSPFYRIQDLKQVSDIIKKIDDWKGIQYYYLREAICLASEYSDTFRKKQSDMFALTTHQRDTQSKEYGLLPNKNFQMVKEQIQLAFR